MPEGYENMKNRFIKEGMSEKKAKAKAAKIWNAKHPSNPVTRKEHEEVTKQVVKVTNQNGQPKVKTKTMIEEDSSDSRILDED
jgi:DNA invertase Pin-like site-specific DNA recombinase